MTHEHKDEEESHQGVLTNTCMLKHQCKCVAACHALSFKYDSELGLLCAICTLVFVFYYLTAIVFSIMPTS